MNYKSHFIGGVLTISIYLLVLTNYFSYAPTSTTTILILLIGIGASLLPDIDTNSRIRKITDPLLIILSIAFAFINIYVTGILLFVLVLSRLVKHRGLFHSWIFNAGLSLLIYSFLGKHIAISYLIGFITHKILDLK